MKLQPRKGVFVTFEGIEGSGKTTQITRLKEIKHLPEELFHIHRLEDQKILDSDYVDMFHSSNTVFTHEPGGTILGQKLRDLFFSENMDFLTELLLIYAARNEHLQKVIHPALILGKIVFCDRYIDSTFVYQGYRGSLNLSLIDICNNLLGNYLQPDLTFLLDVPVELAKIRKEKQGIPLTRFDQEDQEQNRQNYLKLAKKDPDRIILIDTSCATIDSITRIILTRLFSYISKNRKFIKYL